MNRAQIGSVLDKLRVLMRESYDVFDDKPSCADLTYSQCHTLMEVGARGRVSLVDLASSLGLDTSTMSRIIQSLVVLGLVSRTADEKDRRYVRISLSDRGKEVYEAVGRLYFDFMAKVFARIPARKHGVVLEGVGLFADAMQRANETGRGGRKPARQRRSGGKP